MAVDSGLCGHCVARRTVTRATYLPAADPPEKVRVPPAPSRAPNGPRRSRMRRYCCTGAPDIGRAHPGGVAARGRSPWVVDRSIAQPRRLPRTPLAPGSWLQPARSGRRPALRPVTSRMRHGLPQCARAPLEAALIQFN